MPAADSQPDMVLVHPVYLAGPGSADIAFALGSRFGWYRPEDAVDGIVLVDPSERVTLEYQHSADPNHRRWTFTALNHYAPSPYWTAVFDALVPEEILTAFVETMAARLVDGADNYADRHDSTGAAQKSLQAAGWTEQAAPDGSTYLSPDRKACVHMASGTDQRCMGISAAAGHPGRTWAARLEGQPPPMLALSLTAAMLRPAPALRGRDQVPPGNLAHLTVTEAAVGTVHHVVVAPRYLAGRRSEPLPSALVSARDWASQKYDQRLIITSPDGRLRIGCDEPGRSWQIVASTDSLGDSAWRASFSAGTPDEIVEECLHEFAEHHVRHDSQPTADTLPYGPSLSGHDIIQPFRMAGWHVAFQRGGVVLIAPDAQATAEVWVPRYYGDDYEEEFGRRFADRRMDINVSASGARWSAQFDAGVPNEVLRAAAVAIARPEPVARAELGSTALSLPLLTIHAQRTAAASRRDVHAAARRRPSSQQQLPSAVTDPPAQRSSPRRPR